MLFKVTIWSKPSWGSIIINIIKYISWISRLILHALQNCFIKPKRISLRASKAQPDAWPFGLWVPCYFCVYNGGHGSCRDVIVDVRKVQFCLASRTGHVKPHTSWVCLAWHSLQSMPLPLIVACTHYPYAPIRRKWWKFITRARNVLYKTSLGFIILASGQFRRRLIFDEWTLKSWRRNFLTPFKRKFRR